MSVPKNLEIILNRRSIRNFKSTPVPRKIINKIVEAGQRAPTACGMQEYSFILITDKKMREQIFKIIGRQECMEQATVWIMICADLARQLELFRILGVKTEYGKVSKLLSCIIDAALAAENMAIAVEAYGLGSVFIGSVWEEMKRVSEILELPNDVIPIVLLCIGFPNEAPPKRPRWPLNAVLHENTYRMPTRKEMKKYYAEANQKLLEMKYFDENVHSWAEHWQIKFQPEEMKEWEEKLRNDLRELGFLP
jgi:FMN reductase (NADPH)